MGGIANSKITRVQPAFGWLEVNGGSDWPDRLAQMAEGIEHRPMCGALRRVSLEPEVQVPPTTARLAWMLRNAKLLAPRDGRQWEVPLQRVGDGGAVQSALALLDAGTSCGVPRTLRLEGKTHADCLIECERALIWIEGKRFDWLSPSITWDVSRDQLARNMEAVWSLADAKGKDYCVLICHEHPFKHHEDLLLDGYRGGTWIGGWPHLDEKQRREFGKRIGTTTWGRIAGEWRALRGLPELKDLV